MNGIISPDLGTTKDRRTGDVTARRPISGIRELLTFLILLGVIGALGWQNVQLHDAILRNRAETIANRNVGLQNQRKLDQLLAAVNPAAPYRASVDRLLKQHYQESAAIRHDLDVLTAAIITHKAK